MNADDFVFELPEESIAAYPAERRDASRLMVLRADATLPFEHRRFADIAEYLRPGDLLVMNDSRVIPARLFGKRVSGGRAEMLLLERERAGEGERWLALVKPGRKLTVGERIEILPGRLSAQVVTVHESGERTLLFQHQGDFSELLREAGHMPLPPYILKRRQGESKRPAEDLDDAADRVRYQTVYARVDGSVAAPTAGLHFTPELLDKVRAQGVRTATVTLHVGAGTFVGMTPGTRVEDHVMHREFYEISAETAAAVNATRAAGGRVIAVGTTSVRTLESAVDGATGLVRSGPGETTIMISPGRRLRAVDALITNFHLPRSTLLLLVSAMVGRERLLRAYAEAIAGGYRFFSYGDAMFIEGVTTHGGIE